MRTLYRHRQRSPLVALAGFLVLCAFWMWALWTALADAGGWQRAFLVAAIASAVVPIATVTFSSLTIVVRDDAIVWWFGVGIPRGRLPLQDVTDASAARIAPWQGWTGIHFTTRGWLWNVGPGAAVRLRASSGRNVLLGTNRPQELLDAVARARWAGAA